MRHRRFDTFTGLFVLMHHRDGSIATSWATHELERQLARSVEDKRLLPELSKRLEAYFDGHDVDFSDVELAGGGDFQRRCWRACRRIPRGQTISYAELALRAGSPKAFRAAGQAMRRNALPIIVPCHRVIGASGGLHGFGGTSDQQAPPLRIKRSLLEMECAPMAKRPAPTRRAGMVA